MRRRPLCIALDGLPVLDDVGGIFGYCDLLKGVNGKGSKRSPYADQAEAIAWARSQGWTGKSIAPEKLL